MSISGEDEVVMVEVCALYVHVWEMSGTYYTTIRVARFSSGATRHGEAMFLLFTTVTCESSVSEQHKAVVFMHELIIVFELIG